MTTKHTPGPWIVPTGGWTPNVCTEDESTHIAAVTGHGDEAEANARLIAAAPDLLEALKDARAQLEAYELDRTGETYNSPTINAAISKATGGDQ